MSDVIALMCSDLHLGHNPPIARSAEPDWYVAMRRPLEELSNLSVKYGDCPVIIAGDIFHKWQSNPEIVNFAIDNLPSTKVYSIPGQHDEPYHDYVQLRKSGYGTLMRTMLIEDLGRCSCYIDDNLGVHSFPFGFSVEPLSEKCIIKTRLQIAVIHSYIWHKDCKYPTAPIQANLSGWKNRLKGYDVAVFGDNHIGFLAKSGDCNVINCGSLIPRNIDQKDYKPSVGLLHEDGTITRHFLDISQDKWIDDEDMIEAEVEKNPEMDKFLNELKELDTDSPDFAESVRRYVDDKVKDPLVKELLIKILDETSKGE